MDLPAALPHADRGSHMCLVMDGERLLGLFTAENLYEFMMLRQVSVAQSRSGQH